MLTFKHKILLAFLAIFLAVVLLTIPFAEMTVMRIAKKAMEDRAKDLIEKIETAPDDEELVETLKMQKPLVFFRIAVITNKSKILYDSHIKRILGDEFSTDFVVHHPEVDAAFQKGVGYHEEYSSILDQDFAYFAKAFDFHGKTYVLRTAFPLTYVKTLSRDFEFGFVLSVGAVLLIFSLLTWFVIAYLTNPIQKITQAIKPYQEGKETTLPKVQPATLGRSDEFGALGRTLNSLSDKIQHHINSLTEEKNEKAAVLDSLNEGVIAVDKSFRITFLNHMAKKLFSIGDEMIGEPLSILKEAKCWNLVEKCQAEQTVLTDAIELLHGREKLFLDLVAAPKDDGAVLVLQDKSPHYKMLEMRKDFIANASHELKTPITIIRGFSELLHENKDLPKAKLDEITGTIVKNCTRMSTLIGDLLKLSDLEKLPQARLEMADLNEILKRAIEQTKLLHPDSTIFVQMPAEEVVSLVDPSLIELAVSNLLDNGAKYSDTKASLSVTLAKVEDKIELVIEDRGIGIPEDELPYIFDRFFRAKMARGGKREGSGLGLSIVQTIIHKHYGTIKAESTLGKGSRFVVTLPAPPAS